MGFPIKKAGVLELLKKHGEDGQEKFDYETFKVIVADKLLERTPQVSMQISDMPIMLIGIHPNARDSLAMMYRMT